MRNEDRQYCIDYILRWENDFSQNPEECMAEEELASMDNSTLLNYYARLRDSLGEEW